MATRLRSKSNKTKSKSKSLSSFKVIARVYELVRDEHFPTALIIFFSSLFFLSLFIFYPLEVVIILSLLLAILSYKSAPLSLILEFILVLPSIAYQSVVSAWLFLIPLSISLFFAFKKWDLLAFIILLVSSQFVQPPLSTIGALFFPFFIAMAVYYLGSKNSVFVSLSSVILIMLFQGIWAEKVIFLPSNLLFETELDLSHVSKPYVSINLIIQKSISSLIGMFDFSRISHFGDALVFIFSRIISIAFNGIGFLNLLVWSISLFLTAMIPSIFSRKTKYSNLIGTLPLYLIPLEIYFLKSSTNASYIHINDVFSVFLSTVFASVLMLFFSHFNINLSREKYIQSQNRLKKFGRFGVENLSTTSGLNSLDDVGGYEAVKRELREAIANPLQDKELSFAYNLKPAKGILLFGPPGTGKTLIISALAKEVDYAFFYVKASELMSQWHGESEKNVGELFEEARKNAPCILFFDELEVIAKSRDKYQGDDIAPRVLGRLLQEMDGVKTEKQVIVVGATNMPDILDPAILRPGRLDKIIYMPVPDFEARLKIFEIHTRDLPLSEDIDFNELAKITKRYTGADIKHICEEAKQLAARRARQSGQVEDLTQQDFKTVIEYIRPSVTNSMLEKYEEFRLLYERAVLDKPKKQNTKVKPIEWEDVVGLTDVKKSLLEAIEFPLLYEDDMDKFQVKPSKGILLYGPPGCGKTFIVKAAANELNATFLSISGAELAKKGISNISQTIKETFSVAKDNAPSIIFIDEIETIAPSREFSLNGAVSQLLVELDGVSELKKVVLIGATNRPDRLDEAILRPGRFDKIFYVPPPDFEARMDLFKKNLSGEFDARVDFEEAANLTQGFSGADIASICQAAKMQALRKYLESGKKNVPIVSTDMLKSIILSRKPSITENLLLRYERFKEEYGTRV